MGLQVPNSEASDSKFVTLRRNHIYYNFQRVELYQNIFVASIWSILEFKHSGQIIRKLKERLYALILVGNLMLILN